ncbi:MAG TPA: DEAD/DEAH box helicase family protein [Gemmataceae bacterium]|nr:DEAD/DEAH box helicase family protein [Gemmataceae bacterium]
MERWPHQVRAVQETLAAIDRGERRICVTSPTGGGKSRMICDVIEDLTQRGWHAVIYTNRKLLIEQLGRVLDKHGIDHGVRAAEWSDEGRFEPVQISSLPTERSRVLTEQKWQIHGAGRQCIAIVDEAHLNAGPTVRRIFQLHEQAGHVRVGFTATPLDLGDLYDHLVIAGTTSELHNCRALVPCHHYGPDEPDLRHVGRVRLGHDLIESQNRKAIMTPTIFGRVWTWFVPWASQGASMPSRRTKRLQSTTMRGLLTIAVGAWHYSHLLRPLLMRAGWGCHLFRVVAVKAEASRVWTIALDPVGKRFGYAPGQFQFIRIRSAEVGQTEHPFTIASSPARQTGISLTIKESGDFTRNIGLVQPGDYATVHGPFGRFSHTLHRDEQDLVFVAAGVGITPLVSMLRYMADVREPLRVLLVYASRTLEDILFRDELRAIEAAEYPALKVVHVLSNPPADWRGEVGRLDADRLMRLSGDTAGKAFYLCCPPAMIEALLCGLRRHKISPARIHADYFSI